MGKSLALKGICVLLFPRIEVWRRIPMARFSVSFQEYTPKNDAQWHARTIYLGMWQDLVPVCSKRHRMVLVESNVVQIILETVFSATSRLISAVWLNLIIFTRIDCSVRSLSFVFEEPEIILISSASLLESSCSSSIDYPTSWAIAAASRFLKATSKSSPAESDLYSPSSVRLISSRPSFVTISPSKSSAAVS